MLRNILYVHTGSGFVLRIECNDLLDITEHFSIGETIDVSLVDQPPFREIPFGTVARTETDLQRPARELQVGKKVTGKVVRLLPGGAIVLVADHCPVFLPAASVMPGKEFVGAALQCGDMLEGLVSVVNDPSAEGDKGSSVKGVMSFSRLVQPSTVSRQTRSPLIDVSAERKAAVRGGFGRDATFRFEVLQANEYTCCFCGQNFSVEKATAMEAAHIVPRAKRGTDHISNGLCLCPVHHWAFDRGLWAIDDSRVIRIAAAVRRQRTSIAAWLCEFHGKSATFPVRTVVSFEAIDWHRRNVFLDADDSDDVKLQ